MWPTRKKQIQKIKNLFHEGEACASPLNTILRRNSDFSKRVKHVLHPKKKNSKHKILCHKGEACGPPEKNKFKK